MFTIFNLLVIYIVLIKVQQMKDSMCRYKINIQKKTLKMSVLIKKYILQYEEL